MATLVSERTDERQPCSHLDMLRHWSSPEIILAVTDTLDEESLEFHAILQARQSQAKVLLVQVNEDSSSVAHPHHMRRNLSKGLLKSTKECAERICRHLRLSGIPCEPLIVRGLRATEIPSIARSCCADRVLVSAPAYAEDNERETFLADHIIENFDMPVCVVGRDLSSASRYQRPSRRLSLVFSSHGSCEVPIAFSSRLAQELHSQLTIMHVSLEGTGKGRGSGEELASFTARLPSWILEEARQLCPIEIFVKHGDPTTEILNYDSRFKQDFLILAPARDATPRDFGMPAMREIIREALCPVIVLTERRGAGS